DSSPLSRLGLENVDWSRFSPLTVAIMRPIFRTQGAGTGPGNTGQGGPDQMTVIGQKLINGSNVAWHNNGRVYISRALFDAAGAPDDIEFRAITIADFQRLCQRLE